MVQLTFVLSGAVKPSLSPRAVLYSFVTRLQITALSRHAGHLIVLGRYVFHDCNHKHIPSHYGAHKNQLVS